MLPLRPALRFSLLVATLVAANLVHAEVPASAPFTPEQQHLIRQISASEAQAQLPQVASVAAANVAKTIEGEKQAITVAKDALEVGRKNVDWWLSNIGALMALFGLVLAAAGIGIPYLMGLKKKAEWQDKLIELTQKLAEARTAQQQAEVAQRQAEQHTSEIEKLLHSARDKTSLIPNAEQLTGKLSTEVLEKLRKEKPEQVVKLIEQAWDAHHKKDWATAKPLWELLSLIESHDANVWFNLAFAELHLGQDWQRICDSFQRSHLLEPDAIACYNWGTALSDWANTLEGEAQQQRFAEADQRYAEATRLKPDDADAYYNWSNALLYWAHTLGGNERAEKLAKAEEVLLLAKDKGEKDPYNLACLRAMQQRPDEARVLLEEARGASLLPDFEHLSTDKDLDSLRELDWFKQLLEEVRQQESEKVLQPA